MSAGEAAPRGRPSSSRGVPPGGASDGRTANAARMDNVRGPTKTFGHKMEIAFMTKRKRAASAAALNAAKLLTFSPIVMALRIRKIAAGGAAAKSESRRMTSEKIKAAADVTMDATKSVLLGRPQTAPGRALDLYQRRVAANLKRLLR